MKSNEELQREILLAQMAPKTNHVLHLLLSVLTVGFWLPVWLLVAAVNQHKAYHVTRQSNDHAGTVAAVLIIGLIVWAVIA